MSDIGTITFDAVYAGMPEARATATFGRVTVSRAICAGVGQTRNPTEIGAGIEYDVTLRIVASDDPSTGSKLDDIAKVTAYGQTAATSYRIIDKRAVGGIVAFQLEYRHGR